MEATLRCYIMRPKLVVCADCCNGRIAFLDIAFAISAPRDRRLVLPFVQTAPQILHDRGLRNVAASHICPCIQIGTLLAKVRWQRGQPPAKRFPSRARAGPNAGPAAPPHDLRLSAWGLFLRCQVAAHIGGCPTDLR